jgi:hypothetical protein
MYCNIPIAETGGSFCLSSYSTVCLDVAGRVYKLMLLLLYVSVTHHKYIENLMS